MSTNLQHNAVFRFGEFTFHCGSRRLIHGTEERHLSPKAHQLLRLLLVAQPRALSRQDLYDELWPATFVSETNLASIVNELRRALRDDPRAPQYIRTVHGFGYAFCGDVTMDYAESATFDPNGAVTFVLGCEGRTYPLRPGETALGRGINSGIVIDDRTVSRRHAVITILDGVVSIRDLDSTNGTYVDGVRVGRSPVMVQTGAELKLGAVVVSVTRRKVTSTHALRLDLSLLKRLAAAQS